MKLPFIFAIFFTHIALYVSFVHKPGSFWISFSLALFVMLLYALIFERINWEKPTRKLCRIGIISGVYLYLLFFLGKQMIFVLYPTLLIELENLYRIVKPVQLWHYFVLFLIVIPSEEIFWRGFIFQQLTNWRLKPTIAILLATLFYTTANIFAGSTLLLVATIMAGIVWSTLYHYTKNIWTVLLSHVIFDLLLLVLFPLL